MTDRERLIGVLRFGASQAYSLDTKEDCEELADYLISKGVTIPVRCGECRYAEHLLNAEGTPYELCNINDETAEYTNNVRHPNGFCSYGEMKEE